MKLIKEIAKETMKETIAVSAFLALGSMIVYGLMISASQNSTDLEALSKNPEITKIASIDNCDVSTINRGIPNEENFKATCNGVEAETIVTTEKIRVGLRGGYKDTIEIVKPSNNNELNNELNNESNEMKNKIVQIRSSRRGKPYLIDVKIKNT